MKLLTITGSFSVVNTIDGPVNLDSIDLELSQNKGDAFIIANFAPEQEEAALVATAKKVTRKIKTRKEASQTEIRQYAKQFLEAKKLEYLSWKTNEVFELVDLRKIKARNFVTG